MPIMPRSGRESQCVTHFIYHTYDTYARGASGDAYPSFVQERHRAIPPPLLANGSWTQLEGYEALFRRAALRHFEHKRTT